MKCDSVKSIFSQESSARIDTRSAAIGQLRENAKRIQNTTSCTLLTCFNLISHGPTDNALLLAKPACILITTTDAHLTRKMQRISPCGQNLVASTATFVVSSQNQHTEIEFVSFPAQLM